jgi:carbonic anhydrase
MSVIEQLVSANRKYSQARPPRLLPLPPARKLAVVTCMDARIDPARILGLAEGDAHVIRNAGGRASEALRSLVISQRLLGTRAIAVIHHTDCGMLTFSNADLHAKVRADLGADASDIDFLPFGDLARSVRDDLELLAHSPLIEPGTPIHGFVYDVHTGQLQDVGQPALAGHGG